MRKSLRLAAALAATVSFASSAQAATTASATASAEILTTLSVTAMQNLDFGQVAVNGAGTAVIGADGVNACSANLVCTGTRQAASFDVTGTAGTAVAAVVTTGTVNLTSGTNSMVLDNFSVHFPTGNTLVGGAASFNVGGTLNVAAAQPAGLYNGNFSVSVEYQ